MIPVTAMEHRVAAVLGLGRSGRATCRALAEGGARIWAWDDDEARRAEAADAGVPIVDLGLCNWRRVDKLVVSPGIPHRHPRPHPLVRRARRERVAVTGDIELLAQSQPTRRIVGITGTNGKSTTTALIGELLRAGGLGAQLGGNIGVPVLDLLPSPVEDIYVLELSSFQLELTEHLACTVAVILNVSADHLDRHGGMAGYVRAKHRILRNQRASDRVVVGVDDEHGRALVETLRRRRRRGRVLPISGCRRLAGGAFVEDGTLYDALHGAPEPVVDLRPIVTLQGRHNWQNAAAAYATARTFGVTPEAAAEGFRRFPGLAHRLETVTTIDGVRFVNDSKATNPDAAARALASFDAVYWIAGGRPKEGALDPLRPWLHHVRHAYLIGEAAARFADELDGSVALTRSGDLETAVHQAAAAARADGGTDPVVLLAPACASFDQFANFEARGDAFRSLAAALAGPSSGDR